MSLWLPWKCKSFKSDENSHPHLQNYPFSCGSWLKSCETVPTVAAVHGFCGFRGVPKVQPTEDTQTMTHARSTISLVVRVISQSKDNFYDVIRLKIIESWYFPKETVMVGLESIRHECWHSVINTMLAITMVQVSGINVAELQFWWFSSGYFEPCHEKTCLQGFLPGKTQTGLGSHRS